MKRAAIGRRHFRLSQGVMLKLQWQHPTVTAATGFSIYDTKMHGPEGENKPIFIASARAGAEEPENYPLIVHTTSR